MEKTKKAKELEEEALTIPAEESEEESLSEESAEDEAEKKVNKLPFKITRPMAITTGVLLLVIVLLVGALGYIGYGPLAAAFPVTLNKTINLTNASISFKVDSAWQQQTAVEAGVNEMYKDSDIVSEHFAFLVGTEDFLEITYTKEQALDPFESHRQTRETLEQYGCTNFADRSQSETVVGGVKVVIFEYFVTSPDGIDSIFRKATIPFEDSYIRVLYTASPETFNAKLFDAVLKSISW